MRTEQNGPMLGKVVSNNSLHSCIDKAGRHMRIFRGRQAARRRQCCCAI